jgi:hypothetical protein
MDLSNDDDEARARPAIRGEELFPSSLDRAGSPLSRAFRLKMEKKGEPFVSTVRKWS